MTLISKRLSRVGVPKLAAAVSNAGALGTASHGFTIPHQLITLLCRDLDRAHPTNPERLANRNPRDAQADVEAFRC